MSIDHRAVARGLGWLCFALGCQASADTGEVTPSPHDRTWMAMAPGEQGAFQFELVLEPPAPRVGELFRVTTTVRDHSKHPIEGATFELDVTMPGHGHGMSTIPEHKEVGHGQYVSEGMKMHMPGEWVFTATAELAGRGDRAELPYFLNMGASQR